MRITCDVEVANRLLPSFNMRQKGKAMKSQVSIGRKPGRTSESDEVFLMICTKQDRNGAKYKLKGNIQQCFTKFVNEGKATVRFSEPPHDVCLSKADPLELKSFLSVLKLAFQGKGLDKLTLSTLAPASSNITEKLKTKLKITSKKDYPITTNFPNTLESLSVNGCNLKRFDSRMLQLRNLTILDLSRNTIRKLPEDLGRVTRLAELYLADNQLEEIPVGFSESSIKDSLHTLDLSGNKFRILKPWFCQLKQLRTLKLDQNQLLCLPNPLGTMSNLRNLSLSKNQLRTLPATFRQLQLDSLDLFENPFLEDGPNSVIDRLTFPTLLEFSARAVYIHKLPYTEEDVGPVMDLLQSVKVCLCERPCYRSHVHYLTRVDLRHVAASVTALDLTGRLTAPCEAFLCSRPCLQRYQDNPNSTIWRQK